MKIIDTFGGERAEIDCSKMGRSGWAIPSDVDNEIEFVDIKAKYVLVVEKDALWQRLNEDRFWKKENAILMTPRRTGREGNQEAHTEARGQGASHLRVHRLGRVGVVHLLDDKDREHKPRVHRGQRRDAGGEIHRRDDVRP